MYHLQAPSAPVPFCLLCAEALSPGQGRSSGSWLPAAGFLTAASVSRTATISTLLMGPGAPACELSCKPWCRASPYAGALLGPLRSFQEGSPAQAMRRSAQLLVAEVCLSSQTCSLSCCWDSCAGQGPVQSWEHDVQAPACLAGNTRSKGYGCSSASGCSSVV